MVDIEPEETIISFVLALPIPGERTCGRGFIAWTGGPMLNALRKAMPPRCQEPATNAPMRRRLAGPM